MRPTVALRWLTLVALLLVCACTESHEFSDGHTIEIADDSNYWFRWGMLALCAVLALVMIGIAVAGHGLRVGIYALPFALAPILLYPGTTKPSTSSKQDIRAYQAKLDAAGGVNWKVVQSDTQALEESLRKRMATDIKTFADTVRPKLAASRKSLTPRLVALKKAGVVTHADLVKRAEGGDAGAKAALVELRMTARLARAAAEADALATEMKAATKSLQEMRRIASSPKRPQGAAARKYGAALERARDLRTAKLPKLDTKPGDHARKVFESIVGPPPAEVPQP